jgi:hypothetical protein
MALQINSSVAYQLAQRLSQLFTYIYVIFTDEDYLEFTGLSPQVGNNTVDKYCYVEYTLSISLSQSKTIDWIQYYNEEGYEIRRTGVNLTLPAGNSVLKLRLCIPYQL